MENLVTADSLFSQLNPRGRQADVCAHGFALVRRAIEQQRLTRKEDDIQQTGPNEQWPSERPQPGIDIKRQGDKSPQDQTKRTPMMGVTRSLANLPPSGIET